MHLLKKDALLLCAVITKLSIRVSQSQKMKKFSSKKIITCQASKKMAC
jgi:hypothetical protein